MGCFCPKELCGRTAMAKSSETFRKRQRENKLREKAQLKRERREQRRNEKKDLQALVPQPSTIEPRPIRVGPVAVDKPEGETLARTEQ